MIRLAGTKYWLGGKWGPDTGSRPSVSPQRLALGTRPWSSPLSFRPLACQRSRVPAPYRSDQRVGLVRSPSVASPQITASSRRFATRNNHPFSSCVIPVSYGSPVGREARGNRWNALGNTLVPGRLVSVDASPYRQIDVRHRGPIAVSVYGVPWVRNLNLQGGSITWNKIRRRRGHSCRDLSPVRILLGGRCRERNDRTMCRNGY